MKCYIVPVQNACNCNCVHCISKVRNYNKKEELLKVDESFINQIKILKQQGIKQFEITGGGEPFLHPNLKKIILIIKNIIPDSFIKLYTSGFVTEDIGEIDELNISVMHYDDDINKKVMRNNIDIPFMDRLEKLRSIYPSSKIRLSIALCKGAIDKKEELEKMISKTDNLIDSYVVRTLYPETEDLREKYVDFDFEHEKVKFERDNAVEDFDGAILWSDGILYKDWNLDKLSSLNKSYMLLKPDSAPFVNEIYSHIKGTDTNINGIFLIDNFIENALLLYEDKKNDSNYYSIVKAHLENLSYLFGNTGLLFTLFKSGPTLYEDTYQMKKDIRNKYSFTHFKNGYLTVGDKNSHANLVHAPDGISLFYNRDISLMQENGILNDSNKLTEEEFGRVKRYCSYRGIK